MRAPRFRHATVTALAVSAGLLLAACGSGDDDPGSDPAGDDGDSAGEVVAVDIAVLEAPSLTSFYAPLIKENGLDTANGLDITFEPKSAAALRTEVASGQAEVSAGASVLTDVALLNQQGADTVYLFNTFDWWGTVVTPAASDISAVTDLEGETVLGALSTTNYAYFKITAAADGVDLGSLGETNSEPAGLVAAAKAGRNDAVQIWEPAHSVLTAGNDDFRSLDLVGEFKAATDIDVIPYVGVAVQRSWLEEHEDLVQPLYDTFKAAQAFLDENPEEAAELISAATEIDVAVLNELIGSDRLAFSVYPASDVLDELAVITERATENGLLEAAPEPAELVYDGEITP